MANAPSSDEPTAAASANQVSLPRWAELKREYTLRQKSLVRYTAPAPKPDDTAH